MLMPANKRTRLRFRSGSRSVSWSGSRSVSWSGSRSVSGSWSVSWSVSWSRFWFDLGQKEIENE